MSIGGMTCASCVRAIVDALTEIEGVSNLNVDLLGKCGTAIISLYEKAEEVRTTVADIGYECEVISLKPLSTSRVDVESYKALLSIGGMTCASCESAILRSLRSLSCIQSVDVSFLTNSAVVVFLGLSSIAQVKNAVEDGGYECDVMNILPVGSGPRSSSTRTVILNIDGLSLRYLDGLS